MGLIMGNEEYPNMASRDLFGSESCFLGILIESRMIRMFAIGAPRKSTTRGFEMAIRHRNIIFRKGMKTRKSSIIVMLILVILVVISQCSDRHAVNLPTEDPQESASSPVWSPDGSQIIFGFAPLSQIDDTTYEVIRDSCGLWFISPDGTDLSMFMRFFPYGPMPTNWHPGGDWIIAIFFAQLIRINFVDTTMNAIGYFGEGAKSVHFNSTGSKLSVVVMTPVDSNGIWIMDTNGANPYLAVEDVAWLHDWSPDDRRFAFQDSDGGLSIVDSNDANRRQIVAGAGMYSSPSFSPDGEKIVFDMRMDTYPTDYDIYIANTDGTNLRKLATGVYPVWSPDGSRIAYVKYSYEGKYEEGNGQLWIMDANGTNKKQLTFLRVRKEDQ